MRVKEVMNSAIAIEQDASIREAAKVMSDKNIGSLVVVKDKDIVGIITERDIMKNISGLDKKVSAIMSKKVITISKESDLDDAARLMTKNKIRRLPAVDSESGKLSGIITSTDLIAHSEDIEDEFLFD
jgi:CBS domain-containing protein